MGMPCEVNSVLKLNSSQGYPENPKLGMEYIATKEGYRIFPVDVPILLVNGQWISNADVIIHKLTWEGQKTLVVFKIDRIYELPFRVK